jgi:hypothetical protein
VIARRARLAGLLGLALATACSTQTGEDCPGEILVSLALRGVRDDGHTGCVVPPSGGWVVPATLPDRAPTRDDPTPSFHASFRQLDGAGIAYCSDASRAAVLRGTRTGDTLAVERTLSGAVLGSCAATCQPRVTERIEGVLVEQDGAPATFTGTLTETFEGSDGCGSCQLPCTSTYTLTGTAE